MNGGVDNAEAPDDEQPSRQYHTAAVVAQQHDQYPQRQNPQQQQQVHQNECDEVSTMREEHVLETMNPYDEISSRRTGDADETETDPAAAAVDDCVADAEDTILSPFDSVLQENANSTVRWAMTAAAFLFVLAGFLTIVVASQYRFFLACVWVTLMFMFAAFVWFVQQTVICSSSRKAGSKRVFHPAVHAVAGWVQQQVQDFTDDARDYYDGLLLANEAAHDSCSNPCLSAIILCGICFF